MFVGNQHEHFKCPVCLDVAQDPVTVDGCMHLFCKSCMSGIASCPICRKIVLSTKPINGTLKVVYKSLEMKCSFDGCQQQLTIDNYKSHEQICLLRKFNDCGFDDGHSYFETSYDNFVARHNRHTEVRTNVTSSGLDRNTSMSSDYTGFAVAGSSSSRSLEQCQLTIKKGMDCFVNTKIAICVYCRNNCESKILEKTFHKERCNKIRGCKCPCLGLNGGTPIPKILRTYATFTIGGAGLFAPSTDERCRTIGFSNIRHCFTCGAVCNLCAKNCGHKTHRFFEPPPFGNMTRCQCLCANLRGKYGCRRRDTSSSCPNTIMKNSYCFVNNKKAICEGCKQNCGSIILKKMFKKTTSNKKQLCKCPCIAERFKKGVFRYGA